MGWRDENDVVDLEGQEFLDALNEAQKSGHYKGWTLSEMSHGPSVIPMTLFDEKEKGEPIVRHVCIVSMGPAHLTLQVTDAEKGTTYQDFVPAGPPKSNR